MKSSCSIFAATLAALIAAPAFGGILGPATGYNAFIFGNMNQTSDSQGSLAVGGNATLTSYTVGGNLVVGGTFSGAYGNINGNATVAGAVNFNDPSISGKLTSGSSVTLSNSGGSVNGGIYSVGAYSGPSYITHSAITGPVSLPIDFASAQSTLDSTANTLASLSNTGTANITFGALTFTGSDPTTNIFSIAASTLASVNGITINIPNGSVALINVTGSGSASLPNVGFNYDSSRTLWNLDGISTLTLSSFSGSVLAPFANTTFNSGTLTGTLIANSLTGGGQLDKSFFTSDIVPTGGTPAPVPEPATLSLLALGAAALLTRRRIAVRQVP